MDIFKPIAEQLISHFNNRDRSSLKELDAYLPLESRALFNWIQENPTDKEAFEKLKNNLAQQMSTDKAFSEKVDKLLYPGIPGVEIPTAKSFMATGTISTNGDINIKGKYAAGRDVNVKNIFSAKKLIISSFVILAIVIGFLSREAISEFAEGTMSFAADDSSFKILLLPFKADQDLIEVDIKFKDQLMERLEQKKELENLGVNLLNIDKGIEIPRTDDEARRIGEEKNADLVIWGSYEETRGETQLGGVRIRYVLTSDFEIDQSKKGGDTEMKEVKTLSQLRNGYLQGGIDYILYWVEGINAFREEDYKTAFRHFEYINENFSQEIYQPETYSRLGQISIRLADYDKALNYFNKADTALLKIYHEKHPKLATNYSALAETYESLGKLKEALSYSEKALEIRELNLEPNHPDLAKSYHGMGKRYMSLGKYPEAIEYYEKGKKVQFEQPEPSQSELASIYYSLGWCYYLTRKTDKAIENHTKALEIKEKIKDPESLSLARSYGGLAAAYNNMHGFKRDSFNLEIESDSLKYEAYKKETCKKGLEYNLKTIKIYEQKYDERHPNLANGYNALGINYKLLENYDSSVQYYKKAINIMEAVYKEPNQQLGYAYQSAGTAFNKVGAHEQALEYFQKSLEINLVVFGNEHPIHGYVYHEMGESYFKLKLYKQALNNTKRAKVVWEKFELPELKETLKLEKEIKEAMS